jgi:hypothetical protein
VAPGQSVEDARGDIGGNRAVVNGRDEPSAHRRRKIPSHL